MSSLAFLSQFIVHFLSQVALCFESWNALCPQLLAPADAAVLFPLDTTVLPHGARILLCENATAETGGIVLIENLFVKSELQQLQEELELREEINKMQASDSTIAPWTAGPMAERVAVVLRCSNDVNGVSASRQTLCSSHTPGGWLPRTEVLDSSGISSLPRTGSVNLHHDVARGPDMFVSAITYLNDRFGGGETIFPTLRRAAGQNTEDTSTSRINAAQQWVREYMQSEAQNSSYMVHSPEVMRRIESMCSEMHAGSGSYFAVKPKAGGAIIFWHWVRADGHTPWNRAQLRRENGDHWHSWCAAQYDGRDRQRNVVAFFGKWAPHPDFQSKVDL